MFLNAPPSNPGPDAWTKLFAMEITGRKQSPIDLNDECCEVVGKGSKISPIVIDYPEQVQNLQLSNGGFAWKVDIPNEISAATRKFFMLFCGFKRFAYEPRIARGIHNLGSSAPFKWLQCVRLTLLFPHQKVCSVVRWRTISVWLSSIATGELIWSPLVSIGHSSLLDIRVDSTLMSIDFLFLDHIY